MNKELIQKISKCDKTTWSTKEIWEMIQLSQLNLCPPYQRNIVWPDKYQQELITSIFTKYPIPHITVVTDQNDEGYIVLDGKQRITSIKKFLDNEISVKHPDVNGVFSFNELKKSEDKKLKKIYTDFINAKLPIVVLPYMTWLEQRDVFMVLNQSMQLRADEKIYCDNFLTKKFLQDIWNETFGTYICFRDTTMNKRSKHLRLLHSMLYRLFGNRFDDSCNISDRSTSTPEIKMSAQELQDKLISINFTDQTLANDVIFQTLNVLDRIVLFKNVCKALKGIFEFDNRTWNNLIIRDLTIYIVSLNYKNIITVSQIKEHKKIIHEVFSKYAKEMKENYRRGATNDACNINLRLNILDTEFKKMCESYNIILNKKNKPLSLDEKEEAIINSNGLCPICGTTLTKENRQIDHVNPKSKNDKTIAVAVCRECNIRKSNFSLNEIKTLENYINTFANI